MKRWYLIIIALVICFFTISSTIFQSQKGNILSQDLNECNQTNVKIEKDYGKMPLYFIPNQGQMDKQVFYYVQGKDKTVYFTSEGLTYSLNASSGPEKIVSPGIKGSMNNIIGQEFKSPTKQSSKRWVVKLEFVGIRKNVKPESLEQSGTTISYFKGKPKQWHAGLQAASKIIYRELWPGIDLIYYGTVNKMKYEFIVHPGADPSQIKLAYHGAESVKENNQGQLVVQTPIGAFTDDTPVAWQEINEKRENVSLKYALNKEKKADNKSNVIYGFHIGKYDPKQTLILDPAVLVYCGYIGGMSLDIGYGIALDDRDIVNSCV